MYPIWTPSSGTEGGQRSEIVAWVEPAAESAAKLDVLGSAPSSDRLGDAWDKPALVHKPGAAKLRAVRPFLRSTKCPMSSLNNLRLVLSRQPGLCRCRQGSQRTVVGADAAEIGGLVALVRILPGCAWR